MDVNDTLRYKFLYWNGLERLDVVYTSQCLLGRRALDTLLLASFSVSGSLELKFS